MQADVHNNDGIGATGIARFFGQKKRLADPNFPFASHRG